MVKICTNTNQHLLHRPAQTQTQKKTCKPTQIPACHTYKLAQHHTKNLPKPLHIHTKTTYANSHLLHRPCICPQKPTQAHTKKPHISPYKPTKKKICQKNLQKSHSEECQNAEKMILKCKNAGKQTMCIPTQICTKQSEILFKCISSKINHIREAEWMKCRPAMTTNGKQTKMYECGKSMQTCTNPDKKTCINLHK